MATIRIDAKRYEDHDDCLRAAADEYAAAHDLEGWDLEARWEDNQRNAILLTVPDHVARVATPADIEHYS